MNEILYTDEVASGPTVKPMVRLYDYSDIEWEEFIEEWLDIKKDDYIEIEQIGGAGDKGRDVIAYINKDKPNFQWDCYQCKHYDKAITPVTIYVEIGKIIYYSFNGDYPVPDNYYIVAPKGVGRKLGDLLNKPEELKQSLKDNWKQYCRNGITSTENIELKDELLDYLEVFDFSIFDRIQPKMILQELKEKDTSNFIKRFGGSLPSRGKIEKYPEKTQKYELKYTIQLLKAYNTDKETNDFQKADDLMDEKPYSRHFERARESFHNAEQLRNFSRDNLGEEPFKKFQKEIYERVVDITEEIDENRFKVVKSAEQQAMDLPIESNPLNTRCNVVDKKGICHQLVNDNRMSWIEDDE